MGDNSPSFADQVNEAVNQMTQDESGKWQLPESIRDNEALSFAANAERRRRDTQSAYTKSQQLNKRLELERDQFAKGWENDFAKTLPADAQADLEELKATDPEAWRAKLNELEQQQRTSFQERVTKIQEKASTETEMEYRQRALEEFQEAHPNLQLTDDIIANDIPPRISKELESGKVTFAEFLANCAEYLNKGKVLNKGKTKDEEPNLGDVGGSDYPDKQAADKANIKTYDDEIY